MGACWAGAGGRETFSKFPGNGQKSICSDGQWIRIHSHRALSTVGLADAIVTMFKARINTRVMLKIIVCNMGGLLHVRLASRRHFKQAYYVSGSAVLKWIAFDTTTWSVFISNGLAKDTTYLVLHARSHLCNMVPNQMSVITHQERSTSQWIDSAGRVANQVLDTQTPFAVPAIGHYTNFRDNPVRTGTITEV